MVSLSDLASKTGYSVSVVSRALNPNPDKHSNIADETRRKIRLAAREAGYKPNHAASFAKRGLNATIGVFLPDSSGDLIARLIGGIGTGLAEENFPMKLHFGLSTESYLRFMRDMVSRAHAGIITYPSFDVHEHERVHRILRTFLDRGGRCISINTSVGRMTDRVPHGVPVVTIDDAEGGRLAAAHLVDRGCRAFMNLAFPRSDCYEQRTAGFTQCLAPTGMPVRTLTLAHHRSVSLVDIDALRRELLAIVDDFGSNCPIGLFAGSDPLAMQVFRALSGTGLQVPRDVKVVGYNDDYTAQICNPPLTSIHQPFEEEGRLVASKIVNMIYRSIPERSETLAPRLVIREST